MLENSMKALIKVQYVDAITKDPKNAKFFVGKRLAHMDKKGILEDVVEALDLSAIMDRQLS
jgi:translation initiation factor RLI1